MPTNHDAVNVHNLCIWSSWSCIRVLAFAFASRFLIIKLILSTNRSQEPPKWFSWPTETQNLLAETEKQSQKLILGDDSEGLKFVQVEFGVHAIHFNGRQAKCSCFPRSSRQVRSHVAKTPKKYGRVSLCFDSTTLLTFEHIIIEFESNSHLQRVKSSRFAHENLTNFCVDEEISLVQPRHTEQDKKRRETVTCTATQLPSEASSMMTRKEGGNFNSSLSVAEGMFVPIYLIGSWEEPATKTKRITVVIDLSSGVNSSDFTIRLLEGGTILELTVTWPVPLVDLEALHQKWVRPFDSESSPKFTMYYPAFLALENAFKSKRDRANDNVSSIARIDPPFPVQTQIESKTNLLLRHPAQK